jgi:hypothetical protein
MVPDAEAYRRREIGSKRSEEEMKKIQPLRPLGAADTDLEYPLAAKGGSIKRFDIGGSSISIDELSRERAPTIPEQFNRYIAPHINRGMDAMFPIRQLIQKKFETNVFDPLNNAVMNDPRAALKNVDMNQADVREGKLHMQNAARKTVGMEPLPQPRYDVKKVLGDINTGEFDPENVSSDKNYERLLEAFLKKRAQAKASGGVIDMDRMRLELMNKAKGGSVMGVNVASDRKHNLNYADLIVDGHKTIESRNSDTLRPYVGKRVAIVRTGAGKAKAIGEVTIGEPIVANKKQFRNMESHHLVPEGSTFDIKTPTKHMYPLSEPVRYDEERDVGHGIVARKVIHEAKGGSVKEPKNTVKAYKLFRVHPKHPGKLFPLFVNANEPVEMNKWVDAKEGEMAGDKVKSKIGPLAYRPGWHAGDLPVATHIGEKSDPNLTAPDVRPANHVWAEVEMPHDVDWQSVANERGMNAKGKLIARNAHITDQIPKGGHYRYKTNSNMTGNWLIGGSMKVNRVLQDKEVKAINKAAGASDLPRAKPFKAKDYGFASGGVVAPEEFMAEEHVNYKRSGGATHAHHLNIEERPL